MKFREDKSDDNFKKQLSCLKYKVFSSEKSMRQGHIKSSFQGGMNKQQQKQQNSSWKVL